MIALPAITPGGLTGLAAVLGAERSEDLLRRAGTLRRALDGRTLWHVNSTAAGGGVAEMLQILLPLYAELGVDARWAVVQGDPSFFTLTKRLGLALYGSPGDGGPLGPVERDAYLAALRPAGEALASHVRPDDVVILHDHQTAGLVPSLAERGARVYWRCHVGVDQPTEASERGWTFVEPLLDAAEGYFFSVPWHVPALLTGRNTVALPPFLAPSTPKNRDLPPEQVEALLDRCGLRRGTADKPLVTQVSRWDELKDMEGVLAAFVGHVPIGTLALVGPDPDGVPDDVDQGRWFSRTEAAWRRLSPADRARVHLVCLPMADIDDNALLVNAVQRASSVVVQKSLAEGFGLTVTEAMWKSRPVVASAVGGIRAQITHGEDGLLTDPYDLPAVAALITSCLNGEADTTAMGARARERVFREFLPDREVATMADSLAPDPNDIGLRSALDGERQSGR